VKHAQILLGEEVLRELRGKGNTAAAIPAAKMVENDVPDTARSSPFTPAGGMMPLLLVC
jgi:hypothetical protein